MRNRPSFSFSTLALSFGVFWWVLSSATASAACVAPPAGLISWWSGEGDATDQIGPNPGTLVGSGVTYVPAVVGQGFQFDGTESYIRVADNPSLRIGNELTIEFWYRDTGCSGGRVYYLIHKRALFPAGANYGINMDLQMNPPALQLFLRDPFYTSYQASGTPVPSPGVFHHIAGTFKQISEEQVELKTYVDGQLVKTSAVPGNLARTISDAPVLIGTPLNFESFFVGIIDEPSIYGRALSASEIQAIYGAGSAGKCKLLHPAIRVSEVEISWDSVSSLTYQIEYCEDLANAGWTSLGSPLIGTGARMTVADKIPVGRPWRYYRIRSL